MKCSNLSIVRILSNTVCYVVLCEFAQHFLHCIFFLIKGSMLCCETHIVCIDYVLRFIMEWLMVTDHFPVAGNSVSPSACSAPHRMFCWTECSGILHIV